MKKTKRNRIRSWILERINIIEEKQTRNQVIVVCTLADWWNYSKSWRFLAFQPFPSLPGCACLPCLALPPASVSLPHISTFPRLISITPNINQHQTCTNSYATITSTSASTSNVLLCAPQDITSHGLTCG